MVFLKSKRSICRTDHVGIKLAAMNNQYPLVPSIRAFFAPNFRTTKEAITEKNVNDEYSIPSDMVPKFPSVLMVLCKF